MLRIMASRASYGAATTLSIPEVPADAVQGGLPRQGIARHDLRRTLPERIALPPEQHRVHESNLDQRAQRVTAARNERTGRCRERDGIAIVVAHGEQGSELPARKLLQPPRANIHLRSHLH